MHCHASKRSQDPFVEVPGRFQTATGRLCRPYLGAMTATQLEENGFLLQFDVPGIPEDNLSITFENDHLIVTGQRDVPTPEGATVLHMGQPCSSFRRVLKLDDNVDTDAIDAELNCGVLSIRLSTRPDPPQQKISIRTTS